MAACLECSQSSEGFDVEFVQTLPDSLTCCVCQLALRDPVQLICGHRLCLCCFEVVEEDARKRSIDILCPLDREVIEKQFVFNDNAAKREIMSLFVYCNNSNQCTACEHNINNGYHEESHLSTDCMNCLWKGELMYLEKHLCSCEFQNINCSNLCGDTLLRRQLSEHNLTCLEVEVDCPFKEFDDCVEKLKRKTALDDVTSATSHIVHLHVLLEESREKREQLNTSFVQATLLQAQQDDSIDRISRNLDEVKKELKHSNVRIDELTAQNLALQHQDHDKSLKLSQINKSFFVFAIIFLLLFIFTRFIIGQTFLVGSFLVYYFYNFLS